MASTTPLADRWVAVYLRISKDKSGRAENVDTQLEHAVAYVQRQWPGAAYEVYRDNDLSAADPGTHRPDYERLLNDIRAGHVAQVVTADQARLTRQPAEWEALIPVLLTAGVTEVHGYRDGITSVEPGKRAPGRFKSAMDAEYVEGNKVKLQEKLDKLADQGRPHGGRTFGYRRVTNEDGVKSLEVIPERAAAMRWAADAVLSGHSVNAVTRELEARGFGYLGHSSLQAMLTSSTNAGFRSHGDDKEYRRGNWEPIFDEVTWHRLCALFDGDHPRRRPARRYLLSGGKACCGLCDAALIGRAAAGKKPIYICADRYNRTERKCCGRIGATAGDPLPDGMPGVESTVVAQLLDRLQSPEFLAMLAADDSNERRDALTDRLRDVKHRRRSLAGRWARNEVSDDDWEGARDEFDGEVSIINAELSELGPAGNDGDFDPAAVAAAWVHMDLAERRQVIDRCIDRVVIGPATPGIKYFDPARVTVEWR